MARASYRLVLAELVIDQIVVIPRKYHNVIREALNSLVHQPATPTRNRKPLRVPNTLNATWEQRFGESNEFRAFYQILEDGEENQFVVFVVAVGIKIGQKLIVGNEEISL
jgi:hypothetical protein